MIDYINQHYEWFQAMQLPLGHHSWWYTNRKPEDCINVKIHAWIETNAVYEKLTSQRKRYFNHSWHRS